MSSRPLIGLTANLSGTGPLDGAVQCPRAYIEAVTLAGGLPLALPPQDDLESVCGLLAALDGLLLTGGRDIDPRRYGQPTHPRAELLDPRREAWDLRLFSAALEQADLPVLGVCLGIQEMNVATGGTLVQHIPDRGGGLEHRAPETGDRLHSVRLTPGTRLAAVLGTETAQVTTRHHQAVDRIGHGGTAVAVAEDGIVEAVDWGGDERFAIGVQWHPERNGDSTESRALFAAFVAACGHRRQARRQQGS
jgi:gamma-glutamyl-gamma-aminobutyrate hydrolase PuuD